MSADVRGKKISSEELVRVAFETIEKTQPKTNALITVVEKEAALKEAKEKDAKGHITSLSGVPFLLKDSYATKGVKTTCASNVLKDFTPAYDATVYRKLKDAGAILIGKCNMDAWGHGGSSENTDFGPVKNPWDTSRVAGGSSGGCAAAIAAGMAPFAIGEDTGGSIRNPSAWCNTTGLKVTYGRVSRYGCVAYASSFDTVGPMGKSVEDCAMVLEAIAGKDPLDATSATAEVPAYAKELANASMKGKTIGVVKELFGEGLDPEIRAAIMESIETFKKLGAQVKELSMPLFDFGLPVYYLIAPSETSSNLARYDGVRFGNDRSNFTEETMRRIMIGTYALSAGYYDAFYRKAQKARTLFIKEYQRLLGECDLLVMPVNPTPAPKIGELMADPLANLLADVYTVSINPVGVPSLAIPAGFTKSGLPIGMQLVGKMFSESLLFQVGHAFQQATDYHTKQPTV